MYMPYLLASSFKTEDAARLMKKKDYDLRSMIYDLRSTIYDLRYAGRGTIRSRTATTVPSGAISHPNPNPRLTSYKLTSSTTAQHCLPQSALGLFQLHRPGRQTSTRAPHTTSVTSSSPPILAKPTTKKQRQQLLAAAVVTEQRGHSNHHETRDVAQ